MYTLEEVKKKTLEYFGGDDLASNVFIDKYCLKGNEGELLEDSPDMMHKRLASKFAEIESNYPNSLSEEEIYNLFKNFKYIVPQGRIMAGLGNIESFRSLSNCLVLPSPKDSYSSIMYTDTMLVSAAKRGCGYGIDLSNLRPKGSSTKNASNTSTGIVPFMERYSNSTREVGQDGRRGACLLGIDIKHPQSLEFAKAKKDKTKVTGANISLKIDDKFFKAVENSEYYSLEFNNRVYEDVKAPEYWKQIVKQSKEDAEPGIFMWDRIQNYDPVSVYPNHKIVLTNACGEQPMSDYDSCRLIILNLYSIVKNPFTSEAYIDYELFEDLVYNLSRIADDLVDLEIEYIGRILDKIDSDPEPEEEKIIEKTLWLKIQDKARAGRRTGMGITALGDMLAALNIAYGSEESLEIIDTVFYKKLEFELDAQIELAKERGAFPDWNPTLEDPSKNDFYKMLYHGYPLHWEDLQKYGRRSINWSTIAPTGTTSLMTQTTSGCEPLYEAIYNRRRKVEETNSNKSFQDKNGDWWEEYPVIHSKLKEWNKSIEQIEIKNLPEIIKHTPYYGSSAHEIDPIQRVKIQAILQKYTTSAISSTINLPKTVTEEEISNLYLQAWKLGCKGLTIYVDGSRDGVLYTAKTKDSTVFKTNNAPKRPKVLAGEVFTPSIKGNEYIVIVGLFENKPYEVFACKNNWNLKGHHHCDIIKKTKGRYDVNIKDVLYIEDITSEMSQIQEDKTRLISVSLRHGANIKFLVEQLNKAKGNGFQDFSKVVARTLKKYIKENDEVTGAICPNCGSKLKYVDGCESCSSDCGYSKC